MKKELRILLLPPCKSRDVALMGRVNIDYGYEKHKLRDVRIEINAQGYDAGGAYWGIGSELRCEFMLIDGAIAYRRFYRKGS